MSGVSRRRHLVGALVAVVTLALVAMSPAIGDDGDGNEDEDAVWQAMMQVAVATAEQIDARVLEFLTALENAEDPAEAAATRDAALADIGTIAAAGITAIEDIAAQYPDVPYAQGAANSWINDIKWFERTRTQYVNDEYEEWMAANAPPTTTTTTPAPATTTTTVPATTTTTTTVPPTTTTSTVPATTTTTTTVPPTTTTSAVPATTTSTVPSTTTSTTVAALVPSAPPPGGRTTAPVFTSEMPVAVKSVQISATAASPSVAQPMGAVLDETLGSYLPGPIGDVAIGPLVILEVLARAFVSAGIEIIVPAVGLSVLLAALLRRRDEPVPA